MAKGGRKNRRPKQAFDLPKNGSVRQIEDPQNSDRMTVAWRISMFDWGGQWGECALGGCNLQDLVRKWAHSFELQTWGELQTASGGKRKGSNHHAIGIEGLSKMAQDRLSEIRQDDLDEVFSFRISSTVRLYGVRDGRVFNALWYDPWHDNIKKAVCYSKKRNT